ncbi:MAG: cation-translocating P-type ATPase [Candidatus Thermoplasmatota archaeon]|nr:cation-translocating P-type ATPase [Candidatus Thermoplasmatota archaeon]
MNDEEFLILDDDDTDLTQAKPESRKASDVQSVSENSASIGSLGGLISSIKGMLGEGIGKISSSISDMSEKKAAKVAPVEELILDDGSLEKVIPIAGESADSANFMEAELVVDGVEQFEWNLRGMDCPDCAMKATRAVNRLPGVDQVIVSATEGSIRFKLDLARGRVSRVSSVLESLGHAPDVKWSLVQGKTAGEVSNHLGIDRKGLRNALLDIPGILNASLDDGRVELQRIPTDSLKVSEMTEEGLRRLLGEYTLVESKNKRLRADQVQLIGAVMTIPLLFAVFVIELAELYWWVAAGITGLGVLFAGMPMFQAAIASIQNRVLGFQVLTSLAVLGALYLKEWPEALVVTGLVALAGHLEDSALVRAREAMQGGLDRLPRRARLVTEGHNIDNSYHDEWTPVAALEPGDIVEIRSGEVIPVDGIVVDGTGAVDKAPLTGEPMPVSVSSGSFVEAGLTITRGPLHVKAEATGKDTRLADLIELVRKYREQPTRTQTIIERFTSIWVPLVLVGSAIYGAISGDIVGMLVLWVVSCPCALLLAAPVPHATALSSASGIGLVARGGDVIEAAAGIELALLDKTGTLTSGRPRLVSITVAGDETEESALRIAAGLEQRSNHPYATTIIEAASERSKAITKITGIEDGDAGVRGSMRGLPVILGRADWLMSEGIMIPYEIDSALADSRHAGYGASVLAIDREAVAAFTFAHDDAREGVKEMVEELQQQGISVEILSGDEQASVEAFAETLGINPEICRGNVDPEGKASWVAERAKLSRTLMAGDGFNDSGALAAADIGVAVGSGEQVNLDAADVLIPGEDPRALANLIQLSKRTRRVVNANIAISVMVTLMLIITALTGINTSIAAGIAIHEASVFLIIINGMFVAGAGGRRVGVLLDLAKDLLRDIREAFGVLFSGGEGSPPSTA